MCIIGKKTEKTRMLRFNDLEKTNFSEEETVDKLFTSSVNTMWEERA
jgi:hypothetical protein